MTDEANESRGEASEDLADVVVDKLLPGVDWATIVRAYPLAAVAAAALGGFLIGRARGREVMTGAVELATSRATQGIDQLLELEPDDFRG